MHQVFIIWNYSIFFGVGYLSKVTTGLVVKKVF
jgi:hypothetical protein